MSSSPPKTLLLLLLAALAPWYQLAGAALTAQQRKDFVTVREYNIIFLKSNRTIEKLFVLFRLCQYEPGNMNLVFLLPHGGYIYPEDWPNRTHGCIVPGTADQCYYDYTVDFVKKAN